MLCLEVTETIRNKSLHFILEMVYFTFKLVEFVINIAARIVEKEKNLFEKNITQIPQILF